MDNHLALEGELHKLNGALKNFNSLIEHYIGAGPTSHGNFKELFLCVDQLDARATNLHTCVIEDIRASELLPSILSALDDNVEALSEIRADLEIMTSDSPELKIAEQRLFDLGF